MSALCIGPYTLPNSLILAPMAGVTDRPFRQLCQRMGAGMVVSEMVTSDVRLWNTRKSSLRLIHRDDAEPRSVQIAGGDPQMLAEAAQRNVELGAQIIDINMGCPAKKVCNKWAGSALMQDEALALSIVDAVVRACAPHKVPVTLKMRTGWCDTQRNAVRIARDAESAGVQMLVIHGRTREQGYRGEAEYDTVTAVKNAVRVPVVANGDITTPLKAREVLRRTGVDAVMVGRAAQGQPWIFRQMAHFLDTGTELAQPLVGEVKRLLLAHLEDHYDLYGEHIGVLSARKHIGWYVRSLPGGEDFRSRMNLLTEVQAQSRAVADYFDALGAVMDRLPVPAAEVADPAMSLETP